MNFFTAAKELCRNIEVLENTFSRNNLRVIKIGCRPYNENIGSLYFYVELEAINGESITHDMAFKLNIYDDEDDLFTVEESKPVKASCFAGYDTIEIHFGSDQVLNTGKRGKLYAVREEPSRDEIGW